MSFYTVSFFKFISIEAAKIICHLPGIEYDGQCIVMEQLEEDSDTVRENSDLSGSSLTKQQIEDNVDPTESSQTEELKRSCYVVISRLPSNLDKVPMLVNNFINFSP